MRKIARNKKRKKRKLKKRFVVLIVIFIILIMLIMILNSLNKISEDKPSEDLAELTAKDNITDDDIYEKYDCKDISKQYIDDNLQINLSFNKDLFDEQDNSNKEYFESIIKELVKKYERDFVLIDKDKNIIIKVNVNTIQDYNYTINNIEDYFNQAEEFNEKLKDYEKIKTTDADISNTDFKMFNMNSWSTRAAGVEIKEIGDGYLDYGNYKVLTNNTFIKTIILGLDFEGEIIEGLKVGETFEDIKQKLGEPVFKKSNMIGYKTNDVYVFFYNNEVAIYPNEYFSNLGLENLIEKYVTGEYRERSELAYDIVHTYLDFHSYIDNNNTLNIESPVRGMKIKITNQGDISSEIYNNYDITEKTKKYIRENIIKTNFETDLVYENEIDRNN